MFKCTDVSFQSRRGVKALEDASRGKLELTRGEAARAIYRRKVDLRREVVYVCHDDCEALALEMSSDITVSHRKLIKLLMTCRRLLLLMLR